MNSSDKLKKLEAVKKMLSKLSPERRKKIRLHCKIEEAQRKELKTLGLL